MVRPHKPIAVASNPRCKRRADAAPNGALDVRVCVSYKDAAPPALRQWERDWGQGGTCPSQGGWRFLPRGRAHERSRCPGRRSAPL